MVLVGQRSVVVDAAAALMSATANPQRRRRSAPAWVAFEVHVVEEPVCALCDRGNYLLTDWFGHNVVREIGVLTSRYVHPWRIHHGLPRSESRYAWKSREAHEQDDWTIIPQLMFQLYLKMGVSGDTLHALLPKLQRDKSAFVHNNRTYPNYDFSELLVLRIDERNRADWRKHIQTDRLLNWTADVAWMSAHLKIEHEELQILWYCQASYLNDFHFIPRAVRSLKTSPGFLTSTYSHHRLSQNCTYRLMFGPS